MPHPYPDSHTVIVTGGGTGGHIFPALALAEELKRRHPHLRIEFAGAEGGMEATLVPKSGLPFHGITIAGIQRRLTLQNLLRNLVFPFKLLKGFWQARTLVKAVKPRLVIGMGGYASFPTLYAARQAGVPIVLTEQNAFPGLVNRRLAPKAEHILLGNEAAARHFGADAAKCLVTGNPIRANLRSGNREAARQQLGIAPDAPVLLVIGGSLGARTLNEALLGGLHLLRQSPVQVLWQCGKLYYEALKPQVTDAPNVRLMAFVDDMAAAYAAADLVVSRAGAISMSELAELSKPAILVPSPNVADDHQTQNARSLADKGAAVIVTDSDAREQLVPLVLELLGTPDSPRRLALQQAADSLPKADAAARMADAIAHLLPA